LTEGVKERLCECGGCVAGGYLQSVRQMDDMECEGGGCGAVAQMAGEDADHTTIVRVLEMRCQIVVQMEPAEQQQGGCQQQVVAEARCP